MPAAWISAGVGVYNALEGGPSSSNSQSTQKQEIDPRLQALLYGEGGNNGLLSQIAAQSGQAQSGGLTNFGKGVDSYLNDWGLNNLVGSQQAAQALQGTANPVPYIESARINAPAQNGLNLASAYDRTINGNSAENPYLTRAIQGGLDQSTNTFNQQQRLATRNLQENILPGIKSNSIISGGYGGSRQGIAEGRAIGDFSQGQQDAIRQFGQNNTNAAVGAQANAFESGQNRSLAALQGLSGQQYGVASQNASMENQGSLANQSAYLQNNQNNTQAQATGIGLSSGLLGQAYGYGQNANNAGLNRLTQVSGALSPFTGYGGTTTSNTPYYSNGAANALGGAAAGLGLYNQFRNNGGNSGNVPSSQTYADMDWFTS